MYRYLVFLKQVPSSTKVTIDPKTKTLVRSSAATMTNPDDLHALREALLLKESHGGEIVAITMGPPQAVATLREALLHGADRAVLLSDYKFAGSDTLATSRVLAAAARALAPYRMLFFGHMAIDGDTAQVGPEVAALLDVPQATQLRSVVEWGDSSFIYIKDRGAKQQRVEVDYPAVITTSKEVNTLKVPTINSWRKAQERTIEIWSSKDIDIDSSKLGLGGSPTEVVETDTPNSQKETIWLDDPSLLISIIGENNG